VSFVDEHKDRTDGGLRWGVESICRVLVEHGWQIAPATYYAAKTRAPSARAVRDRQLQPRIAAIHAANYGVYGVRKVHAALRREGIEIGRDQTGRLMRTLGLAGVRRGAVRRTTVADGGAARRTWSSATSPPPDRTSCGSPTSSATRRSRTEWGWETFTAGPSQRPGCSWGQPEPGDAGEGGKQAPTTTRRVSTAR